MLPSSKASSICRFLMTQQMPKKLPDRRLSTRVLLSNFTAIINPPEAAILSISSVRKTPVVIEEDGEDKIVIRPMMNIQLSVDHRLIDGLLASQFVEYMKELLENPLKILL